MTLPIKPAGYNDLQVVEQTYLPTNVQFKRNPFNQVQTYGNGGGGIIFGAPGGPGEVGYQYSSQDIQYTITAWGGDPWPDIILTLIEGQ